MFYTEKKLEDNQICLRREIIKMLLAALPFLAVCVVGFAARNQTVCTIGSVSYTHLTLPTKLEV